MIAVPTVRRPATVFLLALLFATAGAAGAELPAPPPDSPPTLALTGVSVIAMTGEPPATEQTVVIADGRIAALGPAAEVVIPEGAEVVDAAGKFLIPGLWDMHVHLLYESALELYLRLLAANGVTGVRDMNGPMPLAESAELARRIAAGEVLGPRFVTPGPLVDGPARSPGARGPGVVVVASAEEAAGAVRDLKRQGADFVKVYNNLSPELFEAVAAAARQQGIPFAGHIPHAVRPTAAAEAGMASVEHLGGVLEASSAAGEALRQLTLSVLQQLTEAEGDPSQLAPETVQELFATRQRVLATYEPEKAAALAETFARHGTWQCPTLVSNRALDLGALEPAFAADPRRFYVPRELRQGWVDGAGRHPYRADPEQRRRRFELIRRLVGEMHRAGVPLLAGTDLGVPFVYAGFSLHDELELLVEAGLTPEEALATATVNPARFLGRLDELGTVEKGKRADLVLLDANPLDDITNTRRIHAVVQAGHLLDRADLDRLLAEAATLAAAR